MSDAEIDLRAKHDGEATKLMLQIKRDGARALQALQQRQHAERVALALAERAADHAGPKQEEAP